MCVLISITVYPPPLQKKKKKKKLTSLRTFASLVLSQIASLPKSICMWGAKNKI